MALVCQAFATFLNTLKARLAFPARHISFVTGHNVVEDMKVLDAFGVQLEQYLDLVGMVDTQVLVQDILLMYKPVPC